MELIADVALLAISIASCAAISRLVLGGLFAVLTPRSSGPQPPTIA